MDRVSASSKLAYAASFRDMVKSISDASQPQVIKVFISDMKTNFLGQNNVKGLLCQGDE